MSEIVKEILRIVSSSLQIPTIIILILLILLTILMLGSFVAEIFTERRSLKMNIPGLVDQLQGKNSAQMKETIENSDLLNRQKESARELINRGSYNDDTREALARQLIADEEIRYGRIVKITDLTSRVAPMFGLMGTLIPLGPGLIALGQGDTATLSDSLLIAFDTTVAGLISGAISYVISGIRKNWYEEYMIGLETIMETILDVQSGEREKTNRQLRGQAPAAGGAAADNSKEALTRPAQSQKPQKPVSRHTQPQAKPAQPQVEQPQVEQVQPHVEHPQHPQQPQQPQPQQFQLQDHPAQEINLDDIISEEAPARLQYSRETQTQPLRPENLNVNMGQMSRNTQTQPPRPAQPEADSKVNNTMVQRTFQEEVRAAEQAMLEAKRRADQVQSRQVLQRPDANQERM